MRESTQEEKKQTLRVFLSVDMEGISGIVHHSQTGAEPAEYERGRELMLQDVNAAVQGVLSVHEAEIVVSDGHGNMRNLRSEEFPENVILVRGSPKPLTQMGGNRSPIRCCALHRLSREKRYPMWNSGPYYFWSGH